MKLKEQDMVPEPKEEARIFYAIAEMNEDETSTIIVQDIANKGMAAIKARNLAKKNPDKMYVLFEQRMQVQETCHMTPFKAVQKPADQDEVVNVKIEPMKKGKKPKEEHELHRRIHKMAGTATQARMETERGTPSRSHEQEDRQGLRYCRDTRRSTIEREKMETAMHVPRERIQLRSHANRHQKHNKANEWNRT